MSALARLPQSRLTFIVVSAALLAGTVIGARHLSAQVITFSPTKVLTDLNGTYARRTSVIADEDKARGSAIEDGLAGVDRAAQKRWRAILEMSSLPEPRIRITNTITEVAIATGDRAPVRSPATGASRPIGADYDVKQKVEGSDVVQRVSTDSLAGIGALPAPLETSRRHKLSADGAVLVVETVVAGADLPEPITFSTTYDRVPVQGRQWR